MENSEAIAGVECIFKDILESCSNGKKSFSAKPLSTQQIDVIIERSKLRDDNFGANVQNKNVQHPYQYHTSCYATYTSKDVITKYLNAKRKSGNNQENILLSPSNKRLRSRYEDI